MLLFMNRGLLVSYSTCPQWTSILDAVTKTPSGFTTRLYEVGRDGFDMLQKYGRSTSNNLVED